MATHAEISKCTPKCNGCGTWNTLALPTLERSTIPNGMDTTYPASIPIRIEESFQIPFPKWFRAVTTARVKKATSQFCQEP